MRVDDINNVDPKPVIAVYSFGTKSVGPRPQAQFEFNLSSMRDPTGQKQFAGEKDGRSAKVRQWVAEDDRVPGIISLCRMLADALI